MGRGPPGEARPSRFAPTWTPTSPTYPQARPGSPPWVCHRTHHRYSTDCGQRLWMTVWRERSARRFDLDVEIREHVGVQPDLEVDPAELLQGLVEADLPAVDLGTRLLLHGLGDVDGRHRPEQLALGAGPRLDRDRAALELGRERLCGLAVTRIAHFAIPPHRVGLLLTPRRCLQRETTRDEIVAGVSVRDVDDVTLVAEVVDVGPE